MRARVDLRQIATEVPMRQCDLVELLVVNRIECTLCGWIGDHRFVAGHIAARHPLAQHEAQRHGHGIGLFFQLVTS